MQMELTMVMEEEEILTAAQVSKRLGVTQASISKWCQLGYFPHAFRINPMTRSPWRIPKVDVDAFIEKRRKQYGYFRMPVPGAESDQVPT
jgi:predicted DNA-binding transcriptional regulator AlpA